MHISLMHIIRDMHYYYARQIMLSNSIMDGDSDLNIIDIQIDNDYGSTSGSCMISDGIKFEDERIVGMR